MRTARAIAEVRRTRRENKPEVIQEKFKYDPLGFVMDHWPWGVKGGPLEHELGPDDNQKKFLIDFGKHLEANQFDGYTPVPPVMMSISSAHGTGKSTLGAFLAWFILITRPMSVGTVTAGTYQQLEERTWADIMHWGRMCKGSEDFDIQMSGVFHKKNPEKWKVTPKTADARRAQAFAGQHAKNSSSWFLIDEASEVPQENWAPMYTGMVDGEPFMFAWGQPLQTEGEFYSVTFGKSADKWDTRNWDGWTSPFPNKQLLAEWKEDYGEDSDFYRVRVLGIPPQASALQFIGQNLIKDARARDHKVLDDEPLIVGYDAANGGMARHAFWFRRGLDAKSIPPIFLPGDTPRDVVVAKAAEILSERGRNKVSALFGDQAFGAVVLERLRNSGYTNVFEVNFGDTSIDKHYLNMRAYMWGSMKNWLTMGSIPDEERLCQPFMGPGFHHRNGKLVLESKESMAKRKVKSPDGPDALALTFARKVAPPPPPKRPAPAMSRGGMGWAR